MASAAAPCNEHMNETRDPTGPDPAGPDPADSDPANSDPTGSDPTGPNPAGPDPIDPGEGDAFLLDLQRVRNGDHQALDRLLTRLQSRFRQDGERRVGDALRGRTRVSDVLQDAYVEVVRQAPNFEGSSEAEFYSWITTIIENTARRQHRFLTAKKRKPPSRTTELDALTLAYLRTTTSPLSQLQRQEDVELVYRALGELRDEHRGVIEQVVFGGVPVEEVATTSGRSIAATRMLLSRARAALTVKLEQLRRREPDER